MREILFKAKRIDNGEWVYGNYAFYDCYTKQQHYIFQNKPLEYAIDVNTLCQYIGLTDKNGIKIFENDVVSFCDDIYAVSWDEDDARFVLEDDIVIESFNNIEGQWCEVIGNIFDNPDYCAK